MTDEKKMTQVQALEVAAEALAGAEVAESAEAREVLLGMIEKRKAPRKPRVNKEAVMFREKLAAVMAGLDGPATNADLVEILNKDRAEDEPEIKPQKVSNNIRVMEKEGVVKRFRGEKASDKDTFALV